MDLKYLFECEFQDGSIITQSADDVSKINPTRSRFFDVLKKDKETPIIRFALTGENTYLLVDLRDGHFELNGVSFDCHETLPEENPLRRLIFYRQHTHNFNHVPTTGETEQLSHDIAYCIGWQATISGKSFKETITLK